METRIGGAFVLGALVATWVVAQPAQAIWMDLTTEQATRAEKVGGFNASSADPTRFMDPWVVNLGDGKGQGAALLMTEFLSVAFAAQEAARNFQALQPWERDDAVARGRGKLVFSVTTFDDTPDFADGLRGWVEVGGKRIQNSHWQNGPAQTYRDGLYTADSTFWFPSDGIDPEGTIDLVIEHESAGKVWRFPFDLSKMR
ncbi:MAG: hypothetical protein HZA24_03070 [Nitrospirae bacterium]|nr:hypothetical protein [Nitrospirota bacterium]